MNKLASIRRNRHGVRRIGGYRAKPSEENPHDFFPTPVGVTRAFLDACPLPDGVWCEPAVGDGAIVRAVGARQEWVTYDIRNVPEPFEAGPRRTHFAETNFLERCPGHAWFDVMITNPPFYLAEEFARKALLHARHVCMLLRLAFLESRKRELFHLENESDIYILSRRPSFKANGATDNSAYAWFHWWPGATRRWQILIEPETNKPPFVDERQISLFGGGET